MEVTTDGGRSWSRTDPGLTAIVRLKAYGDDSVFAIGADNECRPTYAWITAPKQKWQRDRERAANTWYRTPDDPNRVHGPGGGTSRPCGDGLIDLAGRGTFEAAVLCADGRIRTDADGRSWRTVQEGASALSVNADDGTFASAASSDDCPGVVVRRFNTDGAGLGDEGECRSDVEATPGATAVSIRAQRVWLWSGDQVASF